MAAAGVGRDNGLVPAGRLGFIFHYRSSQSPLLPQRNLAQIPIRLQELLHLLNELLPAEIDLPVPEIGEENMREIPMFSLSHHL